MVRAQRRARAGARERLCFSVNCLWNTEYNSSGNSYQNGTQIQHGQGPFGIHCICIHHLGPAEGCRTCSGKSQTSDFRPEKVVGDGWKCATKTHYEWGGSRFYSVLFVDQRIACKREVLLQATTHIAGSTSFDGDDHIEPTPGSANAYLPVGGCSRLVQYRATTTG